VNTGAFASLLSDSPMGENLRARAAYVLETQQMEFQAHDVEIGFLPDRRLRARRQREAAA